MSVEPEPGLVESLDVWRSLRAEQQPDWPDPAAVADATARLACEPPLVFAGEADVLTERLAAAGRGEAFLLQGGDCAETLADATADNIRNKIKTILQMAVVLTYGASLPIVKMGRMAGQYAKPRSVGHRDPRRGHPARLPGRRRQRARLHRRGRAPRTRCGCSRRTTVRRRR